MTGELGVMGTARKLGVTLDAIYKLIYAAKLPARKQDGKWVIPEEAVEDRIKAKQKASVAQCIDFPCGSEQKRQPETRATT